MQSFQFHTPASVHVGAGLAARPPESLARLLGPRVLLITDAAIRRLGLADTFVSALHAAGSTVALFDQVLPEPPDTNVHAASDAARAIGATGIVGFGGGSALDVAKLAALIAGGGERLDDLYGVGRARGPRLPLLLVPTTAGTGSEATPVAILTAGGAKKGVSSPLLIPDAALLDPALTLGLPAPVTAATGIDAMIHAIEAHSSIAATRNPLSRGLARQALRLLGGNVRTAVTDGADLDARGAMLLGAFLAGQAFGNSPVAAVHALAYPVGARFHVPHGVSTALLLAPVMRHALPAAAADYAEIAGDIFSDLLALPEAARAAALIPRLATLITDTGLPPDLQTIGATEADLPAMADAAMEQTRLLVNNPRPVTREDALAIYRDAWRVERSASSRP